MASLHEQTPKLARALSTIQFQENISVSVQLLFNTLLTETSHRNRKKTVRTLQSIGIGNKTHLKMDKRAGNITGEQKTLMISFLEAHPELVSSKFTATFSFKAAQTLWRELAEILNAVPGARKDWSQWRKTWHDMRTKTKSKKAALTRSCEKTGGGPPSKDIMSSNEQLVVNLIGSTPIFGDPTTEESHVVFSFEAEQEVELVDSDDGQWPIETITSPKSCSQLARGNSSRDKVFRQNSRERKADRIENAGKDRCTAAKIGISNISPSNDGTNNKNNVASLKIPAYRSPTKLQYKPETSGSQRTALSSKVRSNASGRRLDETVQYTKNMMECAATELGIRKAYYAKKLELLERDVVAKEQIARAVLSYCSIPVEDTEEESVTNDVEWLEESLLE